MQLKTAKKGLARHSCFSDGGPKVTKLTVIAGEPASFNFSNFFGRGRTPYFT
jgi:hypothetical protein